MKRMMGESMFRSNIFLPLILPALLVVQTYSSFCVTKDRKVVALEKDFLQNLHLKIDKDILKRCKTQSLSHYIHDGLKDSVINNWSVASKIRNKNLSNIEEIINNALIKEIELADSHYVFYHGTKVEFLLFQDTLKFLTQINKKATLNDFFLLRIPIPEFKKYQIVQQFLNEMNYEIDDNTDPARRYLLSVNPALFGNSMYRQSSSAFCYFLDSNAALSINPFTLLADVFSFYGMNHLYEKYNALLYELYELLAGYEKRKTGILVQIFIPKLLVNDIAYRSLPRGIPYYNAFSCDINSVPCVLLEAFKNNDPYIRACSDVLIDTMQFRLLLNHKYLLNRDNDASKSPIKMYRYFAKTPKIKKYLEKFDQLKEQIHSDMRLGIK